MGAGDSDGGIPGPSCTGLLATCGPSGTDNCCASTLVPGGTFYRSDDGVPGGGYASQANPATVSLATSSPTQWRVLLPDGSLFHGLDGL